MKKRIIAIIALLVLALTLFAGCKKNKTVTSEEVQKIALKAANLTAEQVDDVHVHVTSYEGVPCYQIHITVGEQEYAYYIDQSGEILNADG